MAPHKQPRRQRLRSEYVDSLAKRVVKIRTLHGADRECAVCLQRMKEPAQLHDSHYLCKECAERWLQGSNKCPLCRRRLFQRDRHEYYSFEEGPLVRVSVNDDRGNLDRLRGLEWAWQHGKLAATRHTAEYKWRAISAARVRFFRRGQYPTPRSNYASYSAGDKRTSHHRFPRGTQAWNIKHTVQADHLIAQLARRNTWLARDGIKRESQKTHKPSIACHPLVANMARIVAHILRLAGGDRVSAAQLEAMLSSPDGGRGMKLVDAGAASEGEKAFALHMVEDVVAMHEGFDVRPKGLAVRVPRTRLVSVEGDEGWDVEMRYRTQENQGGWILDPSGQVVRVRRARSASVDDDDDGGVEWRDDGVPYLVGSFLEK